MKGYGYAGFGFAIGSVASLIIMLLLFFLSLLYSRLFYAVLLLLVFFFALIGFVFSVVQLLKKDYPFVVPTMILNLILILVSIIFMLL